MLRHMHLLLVGLSFGQTYLIQDAVNYVQTVDTRPMGEGYGLLGGFALVYVGLAIATGWATQLTFRMMASMRGQLILLIYARMIVLPVCSVRESAMISLVSTDVQRIAETFHLFLVNLVSSVLQTAIAVYLLYTQLGAVCVAPIFVALGIKMLGLSVMMRDHAQKMRDDELDISRRYRKFQCLNIALVNLPQIVSTLAIFMTYAIVAKLQGSQGMQVSQAITSLAALNLLSVPLATLVWGIPVGWAALRCFSRVQEFLIQESLTDARLGVTSIGGRTGVPLQLRHNENLQHQWLNASADAARVRLAQASFGWSTSTPQVWLAAQKPYYLLLCVQRWLVFVLDLIVAALAVIVKGLAIALRSRLNAGFLGLALVNLMSLSLSLTNLVQQWTLLETSLGTIARIKDFCTNTPTEDAAAEFESPIATTYKISERQTTTTQSDDAAFGNKDTTILNMPLNDDDFSHGQRQLFCIARSMLKEGKILILDEPTSSLDQDIDAQIQRIIREEFRDHTIIMIAHRLSILMDFNYVAVFDTGNLIEFGKPIDLLRAKSSRFAELIETST
ncbi:hypothetical protein TruAng_005630 [Truncatella angustata]|nr:hypothetical protein TruAng_005630 [Truncatella angustata]